MSATPKPKITLKQSLQINDALFNQNVKLTEDNVLLTEALEKERTGDIKLPMAPSVGQYNRIVEWCQKIKNYYASAVDAPEVVTELGPESPVDK